MYHELHMKLMRFICVYARNSKLPAINNISPHEYLLNLDPSKCFSTGELDIFKRISLAPLGIVALTFLTNLNLILIHTF